MQRPLWTYRGRIDCFGIPPKQRDNIMRLACEMISSDGGELQIRRVKNQYDTDRYMLQADLVDPRPLEHMLANLSALMPPDHPEFSIEGHDRGNGQREDLVLRKSKLIRLTYQWQPQRETAVR